MAPLYVLTRQSIAASWLSFRTFRPLFSMPCSLFCQKRGGGYTPPNLHPKMKGIRIMTPDSPSSDFTSERCQYRTATGRQCCLPIVDPNSSFCPRHASSQPNESENFLAPLTARACRFQNAAGVNYSLSALYALLAQGRISPHRPRLHQQPPPAHPARNRRRPLSPRRQTRLQPHGQADSAKPDQCRSSR